MWQIRGATALIKVPELTPDIIISDVAMPGMSGYDVSAKMRGLKLPQRPYLVAVTGFGQESIGRRSIGGRLRYAFDEAGWRRNAGTVARTSGAGGLAEYPWRSHFVLIRPHASWLIACQTKGHKASA